MSKQNPLYVARAMRHMTQEELAKAAGYETSTYIYMMETGRRKITWDKARKLGKALNVSPAFLMGETNMITCFPSEITKAGDESEGQPYAVVVEDSHDSMSCLRFDCDSYDEAMAIVKLGLDHAKCVTVFRTYYKDSEEE